MSEPKGWHRACGKPGYSMEGSAVCSKCKQIWGQWPRQQKHLGWKEKKKHEKNHAVGNIIKFSDCKPSTIKSGYIVWKRASSKVRCVIYTQLWFGSFCVIWNKSPGYLAGLYFVPAHTLLDISVCVTCVCMCIYMWMLSASFMGLPIDYLWSILLFWYKLRIGDKFLHK